MNTYRIARFPALGVVLGVMILLLMSGLAIFFFVAWSLLHVSSNPRPIQADPVEVVNAFHTVVNTDDTDALLALFARDATVDDSGSVFNGSNEIRGWIRHSPRMVGLRLSIVNSDVHGDRISWTDIAYHETDEERKAYLLRWVAVIQNSKIDSLTVSLLPMPDGK